MYLNENVSPVLCVLEPMELIPKGAAEEGLDDPLGDPRSDI